MLASVLVFAYLTVEHVIIHLNFISEIHLKRATIFFEKIDITMVERQAHWEIKFLAPVGAHNNLPAETRMAVFATERSSTHIFQKSCSQMIHYALCFCFSLGFEK